MNDEVFNVEHYSKETALKSVELIMLLLSDAPLTRVLKAIEDFREAVEGEVS